jgi:fatty acid desaturase
MFMFKLTMFLGNMTFTALVAAAAGAIVGLLAYWLGGFFWPTAAGVSATVFAAIACMHFFGDDEEEESEAATEETDDAV